jgi:hypothetical protein
MSKLGDEGKEEKKNVYDLLVLVFGITLSMLACHDHTNCMMRKRNAGRTLQEWSEHAKHTLWVRVIKALHSTKTFVVVSAQPRTPCSQWFTIR